MKTDELIEQARIVCKCGYCVTCLMRKKLFKKEKRLRHLQTINLHLQELVEAKEMAGKGDTRRPLKVAEADFANNWARVFDEHEERIDEEREARKETFIEHARARGYSEEQIADMIEEME